MSESWQSWRERLSNSSSRYPSLPSPLPYNQVLQPSLSNNPLQLARESLNYQAPTRKVETGSHMLRLVQEIVEPPVGPELLLTLSPPPLHSPHPHRDTTYKTATCIRTLREQTSARSHTCELLLSKFSQDRIIFGNEITTVAGH